MSFCSTITFCRNIIIINLSKYTEWFKKMDLNSYVFISWTVHGMWTICITFEREDPKFPTPSLERSPCAQLCSSVNWKKNGYYAAKIFCVREFIKTESTTAVQRAFHLRFNIQPPTRSRELVITQQTAWRVLRHRLLFNWVHLYESPWIISIRLLTKVFI